MKDLVRIMQEYCGANNIQFEYGSDAHINLLQNELDKDKVYLLLFPVKRKTIQNKNSLRIQGKRFTGRFALVKESNRDRHYFSENGKDEANSKYTLNVEPLLIIGDNITNGMMCAGFEVEDNGCDDLIDFNDANSDGIWVNFSYVMRT